MRIQKSYFVLPRLLVPLFCYLVLIGCGKREKSTDELIVDLKSQQESERMKAVRTLKVRSDEAAQVVPALIESLKDKHGEVRQGAAIKLGLFGDNAKEAIPALKAALKDRDPRVVEAAGNALAKIDPNAAPEASSKKGSK